jgi:hypothetical protein
MDHRFRETCSRAVLQWLLEASAEVPITTHVHDDQLEQRIRQQFPRPDNGDGNDNKKSFFTPGKRKSDRDDDDDNDDGTSKEPA